jgi:hypothetical protein
MKTFVPLFCMAILCGCVLTQSRIPGQTLVNISPTLRRDTVHAVGSYEMALSPFQGSLQVVDTQIVTPPGYIRAEPHTDLANTMWVERWLVKRDGTNFAYRVMFDARGSHGTGITVGLDKPNFQNGTTQIIDIHDTDAP